MRTDRQKETTVNAFLWEIQLKILYSQGWWCMWYYFQQYAMQLYFEAAKRPGYSNAVIQRLLSCWLPKSWASWTSGEPRKVVYGHNRCQQTLNAILTVRHQCPHCMWNKWTLRLTKDERKECLCLHWRDWSAEGLGVQRKVRKSCIKTLSCLEWEIKVVARVHLSEMIGRAEVAPELPSFLGQREKFSIRLALQNSNFALAQTRVRCL